MNLAYLLERIARTDPLRPAIFNGPDCVATYGQWAARSAAWARIRMNYRAVWRSA